MSNTMGKGDFFFNDLYNLFSQFLVLNSGFPCGYKGVPDFHRHGIGATTEDKGDIHRCGSGLLAPL